MEIVKKIIICGPGGSGKDYLLNQLNNSEHKTSIKTTTRPKRLNEKNGVDYYFTTIDEFETDKYIVKESFKNHIDDVWYYGISESEFNKSNVLIMTPGELKQLDEELRKNCCVIYLNIDESVRKNRLSSRNGMDDSVERRLIADRKDFLGFTDFDIMITDPNFSPNEVISLLP